MAKYFMFRDVNHEGNLCKEKSFHAAGIVLEVNNSKEESDLNKHMVVQFLDPFEGIIVTAYRGHQEVELFECHQHEWKFMHSVFSKIN